jgi:hypothetical protein
MIPAWSANVSSISGMFPRDVALGRMPAGHFTSREQLHRELMSCMALRVLPWAISLQLHIPVATVGISSAAAGGHGATRLVRGMSHLATNPVLDVFMTSSKTFTQAQTRDVSCFRMQNAGFVSKLSLRVLAVHVQVGPW